MPEEFFKALGKLTYTFAFTEKLLKDLYCTIADSHISALKYESLGSFIKAIKEVIDCKSYIITKDLREKLYICLDKIINVSKKRNNIIHNFWKIEFDFYAKEHLDYIIELKLAEKELDYEFDKIYSGKETNIDEINKVIIEINTITRELYILMTTYLVNVVDLKKF